MYWAKEKTVKFTVIIYSLAHYHIFTVNSISKEEGKSIVGMIDNFCLSSYVLGIVSSLYAFQCNLHIVLLNKH